MIQLVLLQLPSSPSAPHRRSSGSLMTTVTTTTVSSAPSSGHAPTVAAPAAPAQTAYAPVVPQAPAQAPVVASSYTTGSSLPQVALPQVAEVGGSKKPLDSSIVSIVVPRPLDTATAADRPFVSSINRMGIILCWAITSAREVNSSTTATSGL